MAAAPTRHTRHTATVGAPADAVYAVLADVRGWPAVFPPTVHALRESGDERVETIRIWATANGSPRTWTSRRELDPVSRRRIRFRQTAPADPVADMGGEWILQPCSDGATDVVLLHDFRPTRDDAATADWLQAAVDTNSTKELAALEAAVTSAERLVSFADSVYVAAPADVVYEFLDRADRWRERLGHVDRVVLSEDQPGLQVLEMDTRTAQGDVHTTRSVRVCVPEEYIAYKQLQRPALLALHLGRWSVEPDADGVLVTSAHTIAVVPEAVPRVLGPDATTEQAEDAVRSALGHNSRATLQAAKAYAERLIATA